MNILHIDSSPRGAESHSRKMAAELVESLKQTNGGAVVSYRDIGHNAPSHVDEAWTQAAYLPSDQLTAAQKAALAESDELIDELLAAEIIVIGAPMYNFSITSTFKAWIDQIARFGRTWIAEWKADGTSVYTGLATGRKVFIVTSRGGGGFGAGEAMEARNFQDPYLRLAFGFIGITDVEFIHIDNTAKGEEAVRESYADAREIIQQAAAA